MLETKQVKATIARIWVYLPALSVALGDTVCGLIPTTLNERF